MMGGGMHGFGGLGWPGMILGWILYVVVIVGVIYLVVWIARQIGSSSSNFRADDPSSGASREPREILKARYARGEIDREQYRQMLADLSE